MAGKGKKKVIGQERKKRKREKKPIPPKRYPRA
jgi:hypothetical protein